MKKYSISQYIIFSLVIGVIISFISITLNSLLNRYGKQINSNICSNIWSLKNENLQRLFYQICISTKDHKLSDLELYGLIDGIQKAFKNPYNDIFVQDDRIREMRIHYSTGYAIGSYINKLNAKPFVRFDKPKEYFQDVYETNKYNEEQRILLEQAQYTEFKNDDSKAQNILGPKRELKYVGLHFPYGIELEMDENPK